MDGASLVRKLILPISFGCVLSGCGSGLPATTPAAPASNSPLAATAAKDKVTAPIIMADAGMPIKAGDANKLIKTAVLTIPSRGNPFALTPTEESYEKSQLTANLANMGSFPMYYKAPTEVISTPEVEPQPYRRLAGILIGDSVTALIDMGDGRLQEIHPGEVIPGTEWEVMSIDSEKAVLRRVKSRKLPQEVIVHLESAPAGAPAPVNVPGQQQPNAAPGQQPRGGGGRLGGRGRFGGGGGD